MKLIAIISTFFISTTLFGQNSIRVKIDHLQLVGDSVEVIVKRYHPYNSTRVTYFSAMMPIPLPDSLKTGNYITLYLDDKRQPNDTGVCSILFRILDKKN